MKKFIVLLLAVFLFLPSTAFLSNIKTNASQHDIIWDGEKQAYIKAGGDFYIHFNATSGLTFEKQPFNLTALEEKALIASPSWIEMRLARQFELIENASQYASLIVNSPRNYTDEIAFSVATCPVNAMPLPSLLYDNARFIYENAKHIQYARLIDLKNGSTTIEYTTLDNGKVEHVICPLKIYYWYVVHPRVTFEDAKYVYGKFWREYLFYHNDIGYPLLMEKLNGIKYLWDNKTYYPPSHRTWKWSMENHPTAIETLNYWVGKTVNQLAKGDRPGQPNVIAHEHNGFCGEIQQISVAAQRAALIPSVGICDLGEDHVWREFWDKGWHECDNWWADGGGCVANYSEYRYRWHKIISALFAWRGDSSIYDVTPKYIRSEDRGKVVVKVVDSLGNPVDGARVVVFGSWKANNFKDKLWGKTIGKIWSMLPDSIKQKWQEKYEKAWYFYKDRVPGLVPWVWPSIWNYTNDEGICSFNLGLGHSYLFWITKDDIVYYGPFTLGKSNSIHYYITVFPNRTRYMKVRFILPDFHEKTIPNIVSNQGKYSFSLKYNCKAYQLQRNPWDWKKGLNEMKSKIKVFVTDEENFKKYKEGKPFDAFEYDYSSNGIINFTANNCYIIFKNDAKRTDILLNFHLKVKGKGNFIHIIEPEFGVVNAGINEIKGFSTGDGSIEIDGKTWNVNGNFSIKWNAMPGIHEIKARCNGFEKDYEIKCLDASPPQIEIEKLEANKSLELKGEINDNVAVKEAKLIIKGNEIELNQSFDLKLNLPPGDYKGEIIAYDEDGNFANKTIEFTIKGVEEPPLIKSVYYTPSNPNESSDIIVYANITKTFYNISNVIIQINGEEKQMYEYASHPAQPRHPEDDLKNESNAPRYGIELAQLNKGIYKFKIKAIDTAGNEAISPEYEIIVS